MSNTNTGGPAFPQCVYNMKGGYDIAGGMTLRDYFAAKAMPTALAALWEMGKHETPVTHLAAQFSYEMADAMLRAREAT